MNEHSSGTRATVPLSATDSGTPIWDQLDIDSECMPRPAAAVIEDAFASLERENAALSAQVVELQKDAERMSEALGEASDVLINVGYPMLGMKCHRAMPVDSTVTRASVPPSVKDSGT